jgi:Flp pilus assembly protein TadB
MTLLAALAGGLIAVGLVLGARELIGRPRPSAVPRPGKPRAFTPPQRWRMLLAVPAGLAALAITRWPVAGLAAAAAVIFLPRLSFVRGQRRRTEVLEGLEQWVRRLSDMLTASRGLEEALEASARTAPAAIAGPVTTLAHRLSARTGTDAALRAFADDIGDPAADRIAAALIIATGHRGGGVREVLNALAVMLARDVAARRDIEAERAVHRTTVRWIAVFMLVFTAFAVLNRSYSAPYGTFAGELVLALVVGLYAVGLGWLHRLGTMPAPGRFLDQDEPAGAPGVTRMPADPAHARRPH